MLLVLFAAEGVTVLNVRGLLSWHVAIGGLLIPPVLLKVGSTSWRMISYYGRRAAYVVAGPPPLVLRMLGPLVVITSIGVLASGVALLVLGQGDARSALIQTGGLGVSWLAIHKLSFFAWLAAMTGHVLGRTIPAAQLAAASVRRPRAVPGLAIRAAGIGASIVVGVLLALLLLRIDGSWAGDSVEHFEGHHGTCANGTLGEFAGGCRNRSISDG